jgi:hypothetical protein
MTRDEKLNLLREWEQLHADLDAQWDTLARLTGARLDYPLGDAVWFVWDAYTRQLGERLDDAYEFLSWYQLENDMGTSKHEAGPTAGMRPICNLEDLLWVIEATE